MIADYANSSDPKVVARVTRPDGSDPKVIAHVTRPDASAMFESARRATRQSLLSFGQVCDYTKKTHPEVIDTEKLRELDESIDHALSLLDSLRQS